VTRLLQGESHPLVLSPNGFYLNPHPPRIAGAGPGQRVGPVYCHSPLPGPRAPRLGSCLYQTPPLTVAYCFCPAVLLTPSAVGPRPSAVHGPHGPLPRMRTSYSFGYDCLAPSPPATCAQSPRCTSSDVASLRGLSLSPGLAPLSGPMCFYCWNLLCAFMMEIEGECG